MVIRGINVGVGCISEEEKKSNSLTFDQVVKFVVATEFFSQIFKPFCKNLLLANFNQIRKKYFSQWSQICLFRYIMVNINSVGLQHKIFAPDHFDPPFDPYIPC